MNERVISISSYSPLDIYGVNDKNLDLIKSHFPKVKIIGRGEVIKAIGNNSELDEFEDKFNLLLLNYEKFGKITDQDIDQIMGSEESNYMPETDSKSNGVLLHGSGGMLIKARSKNQQRLVDSCDKNHLIFAIGPAGTGKTYTAVALAVRAIIGVVIPWLLSSLVAS